MKKRIALLVIAAMIATLLLSMGMASAAGPKTIYFDYYENYYPYPPISDYTLTPSTTISEGQVFYYSQIASAGFYIVGVRAGSPTSIAYSDASNRLSILVTPRERPVAPLPTVYAATTPGVYGYGYYYGSGIYGAPNYTLVIGPATYKAVRGKSYKFINCRIGRTAISPSKLLWESSDTDIATVSNGVVRARKAGTAVITATAVESWISASVEFTVK